jgi:hypothetical protein
MPKPHSIKGYRKRVNFHAFIISVLDGGEWLASRSDLLPQLSGIGLDVVVKRRIPTLPGIISR